MKYFKNQHSNNVDDCLIKICDWESSFVVSKPVSILKIKGLYVQKLASWKWADRNSMIWFRVFFQWLNSEVNFIGRSFSKHFHEINSNISFVFKCFSRIIKRSSNSNSYRICSSSPNKCLLTYTFDLSPICTWNI